MDRALAESAALLQYKMVIQAATEIGLNFAELTPDEHIAMFIGGELEPTEEKEQEQVPEMTTTGKGGKGGKGGKPKGRSQRGVQEFDKACERYKEEQYDKELAERETRKDMERKQKDAAGTSKEGVEEEVPSEGEKETGSGRKRIDLGEVVIQVNITDSDAEGEEEQLMDGDKEQSTQSETHTYYIRAKEKVDISQQKRDQLEKVLQCIMQSKAEEVTVEEVNTGETLDENAEVEECIMEHITHISWASITEAFDTTEASSTEEYTEKDTTLEPTSADPDTTIESTNADHDTTIEPTSTEEYSEASLSELKTAEVLKVFKNKDF